MDDLGRFCCLNPDCPRCGERGAGNLSVCDRFGKAGHRLLYCNACKARFSEFKGTPLFNSKLPGGGTDRGNGDILIFTVVGGAGVF